MKRRRKPKLVGFRVGKLTLKSGDYLVLKAPGVVEDATARRLKDYCEQALKEHNVKILVLGDGLDLFKLEFE
jgi:hypothetical protein